MKKLLCFLFFHSSFIVIHQCGAESFKLQCVRCRRYYGINFGARVFLDWSPDLAVCGEHL